MLKYSRQREYIKEYLVSSGDHPTADMVYTQVRKVFPRISLGTVYRNLNLLTELGEAAKVTTPDGAIRFDGITTPHYHVLCRGCGRLFDLDMQIDDRMNDRAARCFHGTVSDHSILFYGLCDSCQES